MDKLLQSGVGSLVKFLKPVEAPTFGVSCCYEDHLAVRMRHSIGSLRLDVDFKLTKPWTILFGPSGSGKTTILRAIAGLMRPDSALIVSRRRPVSSQKDGFELVNSGQGVWVPPHRRGVPLASQKAALFPGLTVDENVRFGYPGISHPDERYHFEALDRELPALFQIEDLLNKRPEELSGGEAQRVSLARTAMARSQRILLLDEPFTGLDLPLRDLLIANMLAWQQKYGTPVLSVTHDVAEAFQLGAEVIKITDGRVVAQGPVEDVLAEERTRLLAQLAASSGT